MNASDKSAAPLPIAVLISRKGRTLKNILDAIDRGDLNAEVRLVISSNKLAEGMQYAEMRGIPLQIVESAFYETREKFSEDVFKPCREHGVEYVVMAGYLSQLVIPEDFKNRVVNMHPSLVPSFTQQKIFGRRVHEAALARGAKVSGCTAYFVENSDETSPKHGPIILQKVVPVKEGDTTDSLSDRVLEDGEYAAYVEALSLLAAKRVVIEGERTRILPAPGEETPAPVAPSPVQEPAKPVFVRPPLKLAVLISGSGRTLKNILDRIKAGTLNAEARVVVASSDKATGVEYAKENGIDYFVVPRKDYPRTEEGDVEFTKNIVAKLNAYRPELIVLAGFLSKLAFPEKMKKLWTNRVVNIHPSLIPSFCGPGKYGHFVHEAALAEGVKVSGCTVHFVNDEYDAGPIIVQKTVPVLEDDDADALAARVLRDAEFDAMPEALNLIAEECVAVVESLPGQMVTRIGPTGSAPWRKR